MKINLASSAVAALILAVSVALPQPSHAAQEIILGVMTSSKDPFTEGANFFADKVKEATNGEIIVQVYTDGALGTETEMFEGVQQGSIDALVTSPGNLSSFVPEYQILDVPFLFRDLEHRDAVANGPVGARLERLLEEKGNVVVLGNFGGSVRNVISRGPEIDSIDDMSGINMRVWEAPVIINTWKAIGTNPTVVAYNEVYTALQTGVVEAAENELPTFVNQKWFEPSKSISLTQHSFTIRPLIMSADKFNSLSPEFQKILREAGREAAEYEVGRELEFGTNAMKMLQEKHGIKLVEVTDREKWIEKTAPVRSEIAAELGISDLLEEIYAAGK